MSDRRFSLNGLPPGSYHAIVRSHADPSSPKSWLDGIRIPRSLYETLRLYLAQQQGFDSVDAYYDSDDTLGLDDEIDAAITQAVADWLESRPGAIVISS